jgi:hypothetical protein
VDFSEAGAEFDGALRRRPRLPRWQAGKRRAHHGRTNVSAYFGYLMPGPDIAGTCPGETGNRPCAGTAALSTAAPRWPALRSADRFSFRHHVLGGAQCSMNRGTTVLCRSLPTRPQPRRKRVTASGLAADRLRLLLAGLVLCRSLPTRPQPRRKRVTASGLAADRLRLLLAGLVTCDVACSANIVVDFSQIARVWENTSGHSAEQCGPAVASALESDRRG